MKFSLFRIFPLILAAAFLLAGTACTSKNSGISETQDTTKVIDTNIDAVS